MTSEKIMSQLKAKNWFPLNRIPLFVRMTHDMLEISRELLCKLEKVKNNAQVLNDVFIARLIKIQTEQNERVQYVIEQCKRWRQKKLTETQQKIINDIEKKTVEIQSDHLQILCLVPHFQQHSIDTMLAIASAELALVAFGEKIDKPPKK
jgi:hypothetical protein